jgi:hypothetical protein
MRRASLLIETSEQGVCAEERLVWLLISVTGHYGTREACLWQALFAPTDRIPARGV